MIFIKNKHLLSLFFIFLFFSDTSLAMNEYDREYIGKYATLRAKKIGNEIVRHHQIRIFYPEDYEIAKIELSYLDRILDFDLEQINRSKDIIKTLFPNGIPPNSGPIIINNSFNNNSLNNSYQSIDNRKKEHKTEVTVKTNAKFSLW